MLFLGAAYTLQHKSGVMKGYSHNSDGCSSSGGKRVMKEKRSNAIRLQEYYACACISISPSITHAKMAVGYGVSLKMQNINIFRIDTVQNNTSNLYAVL
jgi:hypothetical protein